MAAASEAARKVWTEVELQSLPEDGFIHEVVDGELVMSPKNNFQHETICARLFAALHNFNLAHRLGVVRGSSAGYWMVNRNCRAPDISFIPKARLEALNFSTSAKKFFPGAPDLAVEILSPDKIPSDIDRRLKDFFSSGTRIEWIIHPDTHSAEVCHSVTERKLVGPDGDLVGEDLLPGFKFSLTELFKEWDWD